MIRVGTRRSALALAQARFVCDRLDEAELVEIDTAGDRRRDLRFDQIGDGRGIFTGELERALLEERIDVAVHSAKDLTGEMASHRSSPVEQSSQGRAGVRVHPVRGFARAPPETGRRRG